MKTLPLSLRKKLALSALTFVPSIFFGDFLLAWLRFNLTFTYSDEPLNTLMICILAFISVFGGRLRQVEHFYEDYPAFFAIIFFGDKIPVPMLFAIPAQQAEFRTVLVTIFFYCFFVLSQIILIFAGKPQWTRPALSTAAKRPAQLRPPLPAMSGRAERIADLEERIRDTRSASRLSRWSIAGRTFADWRTCVTCAQPRSEGEIDIWLLAVPRVDEGLVDTVIAYFESRHGLTLSLFDASVLVLRPPVLLAAGAVASDEEEITTRFAPFGVITGGFPAGSDGPLAGDAIAPLPPSPKAT